MTIDGLALEPGDRVLLLSIPDSAIVRRLAARLPSGILVGIGSADEVSAVRRDTADLDNVMFHAATPDEIPWQEGFFSVVACAGDAASSREVARVLAPGGRIES